MSKKDQVKNVLERLIGNNNEIGLAISVFSNQGESIFEKYSGLSDRNKKILVASDTIFGLQSLTKLFVAVSIMQLVKKKRIELNAPVSEYISEFASKEITISHLLSHTSGILSEKSTKQMEPYLNHVANKLGHRTSTHGDYAYNEDVCAEGAKIIIENINNNFINGVFGKPDNIYRYSNQGYFLLGEVIRRCGEKGTFFSYVREHILDPLKMHNSGGEYIWDDASKVAVHYGEDGKAYNIRYGAYANQGSDNLKSTVEDMRKFICMYMNQGVSLSGTEILPLNLFMELNVPRTVRLERNRANEIIDVDAICYGHYMRMNLINPPSVYMQKSGRTSSPQRSSSCMAWSSDAGIGMIVLCNTGGVRTKSICNKIMRIYCN